ncbi:hypothetical protein NO2_1062 [Candidatus Termititenax persephonae]|uniref:Uncharacterized protein n=1 Tax=Candidatus Termititenax persephonae TaxID=2218525 RepID=A0A388TIB5_9BACT|nr:hypothetical protein NO2_1062 [Candidatus Termititenax persephonae]
MHKFLMVGVLFWGLLGADIDPVADLGVTHAELLQKKGIPNAILPIRQKKADEDDVVFVYADSYFYLYNNHFYRAFFSKRYDGEIYRGLKIGSPKSAVTALWGNNYDLEKDGLVWNKDGYIVVAKIDKDNRLESLWLIKDAR